MKVGNNHLLALCVAVLVVLCVASVSTPLYFNHQRQQREVIVKEHLRAIRRAETAYLRAHGTYCGELQQLVDEGRLADSMQYVPWSGGRKFSISTTVSENGDRPIPLMECSAMASDYLRGLNPGRVADFIQQANASGSFPGLKFGDITTPNNNAGNWE